MDVQPPSYSLERALQLHAASCRVFPLLPGSSAALPPPPFRSIPTTYPSYLVQVLFDSSPNYLFKVATSLGFP